MGSKSKSSLAFSLVCVSLTLFQLGPVYPKPLASSEGESRTLPLDNILAASGSEINSSADNATTGHAFIRVETLNERSTIPTGASIVVQGDSSLRLFKDTDINHPSFDPSKFLMLATNDSVQSVEVYPVSDQPYFMFVRPEFLKNQTLTSALFGNLKKRRIKRHHPGVLQNVLGELQNFALVPIKSPTGQIRYILLKNPKFVIGNPTDGQSSQPAPTIIQLNSNNLPVNLPGGQVRYTPKVPTEPITVPTFRKNHVRTERVRPSVPVAAPIDSIFTTPTRAAPLKSIVDSFAASAVSNTIPSNSGLRHFSETPVQRIIDSSLSNRGHTHVHDHGVAAAAQTASNAGDTTVHKTEVVETVVEAQNSQAAVAQQDTAIAAGTSSQTSSATGILGETGAVKTETAAAASQSASAATATAAKEEKLVKKTKKTTTTVVKAGSDQTSAGGTGAGEVQQVHQVVEETVQQGSASSVASSSETAAAASESAASANAVNAAGGGHVADTAVGSAVASVASNAVSSASAAETNATTSVKKKVIKKTTTITKTKALDTGGLAGMNSEVPKAVLSNLETKPITAKKPPTAILSDNNDKKSAISSKAVLIATAKPKLAAPLITNKTTVTPTTTTEVVTTEEQEIEAEEATTTATSNRTSGYMPVPSHARQPQNNPQYTVAGWAKSPTTEPPLGPNDRVNTTDVPEEIEARPDLTRKERRMLLKRMNPGATPEQIEAQLLRDDKARARMAATQSEPIVIQPEPVTPPTKPPTAMPVTPTLKPTPVPKPIVQKQTKLKQATQTKTNPKKSVQTKKKPKQTVKKQTKPKQTIKKQTKPKLTVKKTNKKRTKQRRQRMKPKQAPQPQPEQTEINNGENLQVWRPGMGRLSLTKQPPTARPRNQHRFYRTTTVGWWMRQTTAPTEPTPPTTLPPTYPTTQYQYFPTTYQTAYPPYEPIVTNPPRRRVPPSRRGPPRRQNNFRQQRRRQRPQLGRRQRIRARTDGEELRPRDPFARWILNNVEGEVLESFLPFLALG